MPEVPDKITTIIDGKLMSLIELAKAIDHLANGGYMDSLPNLTRQFIQDLELLSTDLENIAHSNYQEEEHNE